MKWKKFGQIVLLLIIAGVIFYLVCPKYHFFRWSLGRGYKGNRITGRVTGSQLHSINKKKRQKRKSDRIRFVPDKKGKFDIRTVKPIKEKTPTKRTITTEELFRDEGITWDKNPAQRK